jgi:hypothetical protein
MVAVYRFWRDMGHVAGALIAGVVADALGFGGAIAVVAALTAASGSGSRSICRVAARPSPRFRSRANRVLTVSESPRPVARRCGHTLVAHRDRVG